MQVQLDNVIRCVGGGLWVDRVRDKEEKIISLGFPCFSVTETECSHHFRMFR